MNSKKLFYSMLTGLANMTPNFIFTSDLIELYDRLLAPVGYEKLCQGLRHIMADRTSRDPFPSIREIREAAEPAFNVENEASEIAGNIVAAVSRIGPYRCQEARDLIGETGWVVVTREGGWVNICQALTYENLAILKAQWRNVARGLLQQEFRPERDNQEPQSRELTQIEHTSTRCS